VSDRQCHQMETAMDATPCADRSRPVWLRQRAALRSAFLTSYLPALCILAVMTLAATRAEVPISDLTRDPLALIDEPWYEGGLSSLGCLAWAAAATICLFSAGLIHARGGAREDRLFLLCSGLLTLWLCLDDLYMFHERVLPGHLHISEKVTYSAYMVAAVLYLIRFRPAILRADFTLIILAFACFAVSLVSDATDYPVYGHYLVEDGFKFLGVVGWLTFLARASYQTLDRQQRSPSLVHQ